MYGDPANIRSHAVKVRLSDKEQLIVDEFVERTGQQKAAVLRELIMSSIRQQQEVAAQAQDESLQVAS